MAGTVLGSKGWYRYDSDAGHTYNMLRRVADMAAVNNTATNRGDFPSIPKFFVPRYVWCVANNGARRKICIGNTGNSHYTVGGTITIDNIAWSIEGRVGEKDRGTVKD